MNWCPHTELATPRTSPVTAWKAKARGTWMLYEALCRQLGRTPRQICNPHCPRGARADAGQPADRALIKQLVHLVYDVLP